MRIFKLYRKNEFSSEFHPHQLKLFNVLIDDSYNNIVIQQERQVGITYLLSKYVKYLVENNSNLKILFVLPNIEQYKTILNLINNGNILQGIYYNITYFNGCKVHFCTENSFLSTIHGKSFNVIIIDNIDSYHDNYIYRITNSIPYHLNQNSKTIFTCNTLPNDFLIKTIIKGSNDIDSNCFYSQINLI